MYLSGNMGFHHRNTDRSIQRLNKKRLKHLKNWKPGEIQTTIMIAFSLISISIVLCMGSVMYILFSSASRQESVNSTAKLMEQTEDNIEEYMKTTGAKKIGVAAGIGCSILQHYQGNQFRYGFGTGQGTDAAAL